MEGQNHFQLEKKMVVHIPLALVYLFGLPSAQCPDPSAQCPLMRVIHSFNLSHIYFRLYWF